ncbi:MAG: TadE family protein, partial [bacterium]|nr:TadE family protein [bacterium]
MQRIARKILQILDGTPAVYGKPQKGQSLAEMAFITPLILILIAGIVEIGWLANNYLTLQEVSKVGARRGTTLVGQYSPLEWNDLYTTVPADYIGGGNIDPIDVIDPVDLPQRQTLREAVRTCDAFVQAEYPGFYNEILCVMLDSMEPLQIRGGSGVESEDDWNGIDDIA